VVGAGLQPTLGKVVSTRSTAIIARHEVEILSSSKICLTRFTRNVGAVHDPRFGLDPFGKLAAAERMQTNARSIYCFQRKSR
jgi:hypothetical protein